MKPVNPTVQRFKNISELMSYLHQPVPSHPLIAMVNYDNMAVNTLRKQQKIAIDFYKISFKPSFKGQIKYGQGYYDFQGGGLAFLKPQQIVTSSNDERGYEGYSLYFHTDFIRNYPLANSIHQYGFFSYSASEALFLSDKEQRVIGDLFRSIESELSNNIDQYSQDVLVSQIDLLLNYSNRFYNRQFITRKIINNEIIAQLDDLLEDYFNKETPLINGLPSVQYISGQLNVSQRYLSDMLHVIAGQNTQQYIHEKIIARAKDRLSTTNLLVSEIAYELGFEHPQSFSKLFKTKTEQSPLEFRNSFH
ncbi:MULTISPECIES: AraC family transcriptional regulator [Chryseobacterium]|uniref:AraC-like DNA-binding protein n=1 Tax=Chryseobacterium geocarposphaerae TaxID=1416776 RepID=A0ABU1LA70_9FLAO|nr:MULTISPECIES: helix-turn-helix transcriptional regulator [Chryseobacterium]MDR6403615.1 AraC-like DNA-binding protein [Chryseobacterium geocarposphaerae]MDR6697169.1 AraC-like DNA-binding protein [Chryseobacterium ginsenosidimutans]